MSVASSSIYSVGVEEEIEKGVLEGGIPEDAEEAARLTFSRIAESRRSSRRFGSRGGGEGGGGGGGGGSRGGMGGSRGRTGRDDTLGSGFEPWRTAASASLSHTSRGSLRRSQSVGGLVTRTRGGVGMGSTSREFLRSRVGVGSCRLRQSYSRAESAFHPTDMPAVVRERRREVVKMQQGRLKGIEQRRWDGSTTAPPVDMRRAKLQAFGRQTAAYNFRAEVLSQPEPVATDAFGRITKVTQRAMSRYREMPTHPALASKPAWSEAVRRVEEKEKDARTLALTLHAKRRSKRAVALRGYVGPAEREKIRMKELRRLRAAHHAAKRAAAAEFGAVSAPEAAVRAAERAHFALDPPVSPLTRGRGRAGYRFDAQEGKDGIDAMIALQSRSRADIADPKFLGEAEEGARTATQDATTTTVAFWDQK